MKLASGFLSSSAGLMVWATCCAAQLPAPAPQPEGSSAVISVSVPDSHEDQATTRSVSQIRIVRLSQVRGDVQLDRNTDQKFEMAFTNLPIISGEQLRTQQGVAEVEFEDNSSLRLVMDSQVDFPVLGRDINGVTTTTVNLLRGSIYVSRTDNKNAGDFNVRAGGETLTIPPSSHLRIDINQKTAKVTVFQGAVTAASDKGWVLVGKRKAITFDLAASAQPEFAKLDEPSPFDQWDKNAVDYHKSLAITSTYANSPFSYGVNDLAYYGAFSNVGGCGTMWRPYLANASFDPYASGIWSYYPSSGYSWVSPYPWGWTPFHSGSWSYCSGGGGWGWQPQGGWHGLNNIPNTTNKIKLSGPAFPRPPLPPIKGHATLVGVNLNKLQPSKTSANSDSFTFEKGSAGLGVPRGVFKNLGKMSEHAAQHGSASAYISESQAARALMPTASSMSVASNSQGMVQNHSAGSSANGIHNNSLASGRSNSTASSSYSASSSMASSHSSSSSSSPSASSASSSGSSAGGSHH